MRSVRIALMLTIALAGLNASHVARAQRPEPDVSRRSLRKADHQPGYQNERQVERTSADAAARSPMSPALDQRRFDGHLTPEERHLLRQHIEDAVRDLYKR
jgi:hypothetical protein